MALGAQPVMCCGWWWDRDWSGGSWDCAWAAGAFGFARVMTSLLYGEPTDAVTFISVTGLLCLIG